MSIEPIVRDAVASPPRVDRAGLEDASGECYRFVRQQFDRLLP
jgi:hypothetical protein